MTLTIRTKLLGAFLGVAALLLALGVFALSEMGSIQKHTRSLGASAVPLEQAIGELKNVSGKYRRDQLQMAAAPDTAFYKARVADMQGDLADVAAQVKQVQKYLEDDGNDRAALGKVTAAWQHYVDATNSAVAVRGGGGTENVSAAIEVLSTGAGDAAWDDLKAALKSFDTMKLGEARAELAGAESAYSTVRVVTIVFAAVAVAVALALAFLLSRAITGAVRKILHAAEGIAEGDLDQDVSVSSRDELGKMSAAFGRMVEYLRGIAGSAEQIAAGDLTVEVEPKSERDLLGHA
ncbi:MAG TPA: HAMP domain-containing protein, partial [Gaiellaceae bacterium]|nr:HAMP domain-containing protein [Gaiellaceae bacterium]